MNHPPSQTPLSWNWHTYQRLKLALSLGLRRQIFIAVCDDLALRDQLASQLHTELAYLTQVPELAIADTDFVPTLRNYPRLVSLHLNLSDPNPMAQIAQWLAQHPQPAVDGQTLAAPGFQILGIERLTRQAAAVQRLFLSYLQGIEHSLAHLESSMVLWMPRPWFYSIQQSAPEFWHWHTGSFEFAGEPTPTDDSHGFQPPIAPSEVEHSYDRPNTIPNSVTSIAAHNQRLWDLLTEDLAQLEHVPDQGQPVSDAPDSQLHQPEPAMAKSCNTPNNDSEKSPRPEAKPAGTSSSQSAIEPSPPSGTNSATSATLTKSTHENHYPSQQNSTSHGANVNNKHSTDNNATRATKYSEVYRDFSSQNMVPVVAKASFKPTNANPIRAHHAHQGTNSEAYSVSHRADNDKGIRLVTDIRTDTAVLEKPLVEVADRAVADNSDNKPANSATIDAQDAQPIAHEDAESIAQQLPHDSSTQATYAQRLQQVTADRQPFQTLRYLEQLHKRKAPPADLAAAYRSLGNIYRDRIEQGDQSPQTLKMAIRVYEQALKWLSQEQANAKTTNQPSLLAGHGATRAEILNDLANLHWILARATADLEEKIPQMERSICLYQAAIDKIDVGIMPHLYAMVQNNLGTAYGDLARYRDSVENLQQAVLAYQEALRYRTEDADAKKRAATQNNLGTAYWHLAQHQQPVIYLRQAIAAYSEALQFYSPDEDSVTYAMVQNNLGTAYWNLSQHEQPVELLQRAIAAYDIALRYRTADTMPAAHAATQNNLGTAYWHLANHQKHQPAVSQQLLQQAIAAYLITLNTANKVPPEQLSFDLFATHNNLGLAYYQLAIDKQSTLTAETRLNHLDFSLHHHLQAYNGWQAHPDYAQAALAYIIQTLRAFHSEFGLQGQSHGLSKLPAHLLPQVLSRL